MTAIISSVSQDKFSHKEAAIKHGVSPRLVASLIQSRRKDPAFMTKAKQKEEKRRFKLKKVISHSIKRLASTEGLHNAQ